jgi:hypothetical protein
MQVALLKTSVTFQLPMLSGKGTGSTEGLAVVDDGVSVVEEDVVGAVVVVVDDDVVVEVAVVVVSSESSLADKVNPTMQQKAASRSRE